MSETCPTTAPAQADSEPDDPIVIEENRWRRREGYHPLTREEADELNRVAKQARARNAQLARAMEKTTTPESPKAGPGPGIGSALIILVAVALTIAPAQADDFHADAGRQENTNVTRADELLAETALNLPHCSSLVTRHSSLVTLCEGTHHPSLVTLCEAGNARPPP
jgi:hypothetical protein